MKNPFPYSSDNKRYQTFNYYLKKTYHQKVFKVPLDAGFTCPNRDGKVAYGGCTYCSSRGSGDSVVGHSLDEQFEKGLEMMKRKWPNGKAMAYFQAYTNTYAPLEKLKECFEPFLQREDVLALCIATRADCLSDEVLDYLNECSKQKDIWIEVGLQTIHDETSKRINRGHDTTCFLDAIDRLSKTNCKVCVHLINGLPYESREMMIETAKLVGQLPIHAVKIHMLHIIQNTPLAVEYQNQPFKLLTKDEYIEIVCEQLTYLPTHIIIERLTGDGIASDLIEPKWTIKKVCVLNDIDKYMSQHNLIQGMNV